MASYSTTNILRPPPSSTSAVNMGPVVISAHVSTAVSATMAMFSSTTVPVPSSCSMDGQNHATFVIVYNEGPSSGEEHLQLYLPAPAAATWAPRGITNKAMCALISGKPNSMSVSISGTALIFSPDKLPCAAVVLWEQPVQFVGCQPWPPPILLEIYFDRALIRPMPWPNFMMSAAFGGGYMSSMLWWPWKPPWFYLLWQIIRWKSVTVLIELLGGMICGLMSYGYAEFLATAGLIFGADFIYIQSSGRHMMSIFYRMTVLLGHQIVLSKELILLTRWLSCSPCFIFKRTVAEHCKIEDTSDCIIFSLVVYSFDLRVSSVDLHSSRGTHVSFVAIMQEEQQLLQVIDILVRVLGCISSVQGLLRVYSHYHPVSMLYVEHQLSGTTYVEQRSDYDDIYIAQVGVASIIIGVIKYYPGISVSQCCILLGVTTKVADQKLVHVLAVFLGLEAMLIWQHAMTLISALAMGIAVAVQFLLVDYSFIVCPRLLHLCAILLQTLCLFVHVENQDRESFTLSTCMNYCLEVPVLFLYAWGSSSFGEILLVEVSAKLLQCPGHITLAWIILSMQQDYFIRVSEIVLDVLNKGFWFRGLLDSAEHRVVQDLNLLDRTFSRPRPWPDFVIIIVPGPFGDSAPNNIDDWFAKLGSLHDLLHQHLTRAAKRMKRQAAENSTQPDTATLRGAITRQLSWKPP